MRVKNKVKVLQINASSKIYGGVSAMIFNIFKNIDREKVSFEFFCPYLSTYDIVEDQIKQMGGKIYEAKITGSKIGKKLKLAKELSKYLEKNDIDIIHINSGSFFFNLEVAFIAKMKKVKKIIVHSHNAGGNKGIKTKLMYLFKPLLVLLSTDLLSCSLKAGYYMFPKKTMMNGKCKVIKNGIDTSLYEFNQDIRTQVRTMLGIEENIFLIGHIGRFNYQKNHEFLIKIFFDFRKKYPNTKLLLIGIGELEEKIKELCVKLKIDQDVIFYGLCDNVNNLLQGMDVFVLPSLFEGLPVVGVEAQTSGLKCLLSDTITEETDLTGNVTFIDIKSTKKWVEKLLDVCMNHTRNNEIDKIIKNGYDIKDTAKRIEEIYFN